MPHTCETIVDQGPFEINVSYSWKWEADPGDIDEPLQRKMLYTELDSVELVIAGVGIDLLPLIAEKAKQMKNEKLIDKVNSLIIHELSHEE